MKACFLMIPFLLFQTAVRAQPERKKIAEGNQFYLEEKYDQALNKYRDAQVHAPESRVIKFNVGNAQYKKSKFEEALKEYDASLASDNVIHQSQAYYNMGNSLYRLGKLPESILMYKKALELNPDDEDAKYNLEFVRQQLKNNQDQQDQQNPQNPQNQQDQQNQQQQGEQDEQQQQQGEQQQRQQGEQEREQQDEQEQQQQQPENQSAEQQEISKEDAERILEALQEDPEKMKEMRRAQVPAGARVQKDW